MPGAKASQVLMETLSKALSDDRELASTVKGLIVFIIDGVTYTLESRPGKEPALKQGTPEEDEKPDLTLTMSDAVFAQLVSGKLNPQTAFLMRKLKLSGSMGMAMKLNPILEAAAPKSKL
ncbi:SCP2 sterol-binding domain-containing protein [Dunaliella salina]|uniref:SCP2 sterol-binding domain-containing protein n=1 Tax=Dunaliella salina TaxID=3046 RepID=A0ABQ7GCN8_DUNSA|nr:SCP2 sterol-binding domain-containing protein [Dunaliella salina]|eukprot:KAF5832380.1 SCP2 sterol-binding domain-containing protein [Dunaliella salina]